AATIGDYLTELLATLWREGSHFSAKRPLGSSDRYIDPHQALLPAGAVPGGINPPDQPGGSHDHAVDPPLTPAVQALPPATPTPAATVLELRRPAARGASDVAISAKLGLPARRVRSARERHGIRNGQPKIRTPLHDVHPRQIWESKTTGRRVRIEAVDD